jgi:hypothetical protein
MRIEEASTQIFAAIESLLLIAERIVVIAKSAKLLRAQAPRFSYENTYLALTLDLRDSRGKRALITRKQSVRFLTEEAGVLTSPGWGDGSQLKDFHVAGAEWLGTRSDGPRKVVLLALSRRSSKDARFTVITRETALNSFLKATEYFEARVERPTTRLSLKVLFPKGRPPAEAYLSATGLDAPQKLPVRLGPDGRASLSWSAAKLAPDATCSLRWSW